MAAGIVLVLWQGGEKVIAGAWTLGAFVTYLDLFLRFTGRGFRVPQLVNSVQAGGAAYARLAPLLAAALPARGEHRFASFRSEEHTSELQSQSNLVCRLLLEKKNTTRNEWYSSSPTSSSRASFLGRSGRPRGDSR